MRCFTDDERNHVRVACSVQMRVSAAYRLLDRQRIWIHHYIRTVNCHFFFFSSRRRHTRLQGDWSSDVCSSDLLIRIHFSIFFSSSLKQGGPLTVAST